MDRRGYEALTKALEDVEFGTVVSPDIGKDESVRYITVTSSEQVPPATILNALGKAGLMKEESLDGYEDAVPNYNPSLKTLGVTPGSLTFEDVHASGVNYY
jgi:hypothetical protein